MASEIREAQVTEYFTSKLHAAGLLKFRIELVDRTLSVWAPPKQPLVFHNVCRETCVKLC
jgi:hypothetical protein